MRQSKRASMTALYVSMSAKEQDLQISDDLARAQRTLRDFKSKISSQSKKNFVLEKDVRYLDSRIALLIQNRMALEEVCEASRRMKVSYTDIVGSKMKSQATLRTPQICKKDHSQKMKRLRDTATSSSSYSQSLDTLHTSVGLSPWQRSTRYSKLSCSPFMVTNTKAAKSICF